jgi:PAS domain S-box-containing protein
MTALNFGGETKISAVVTDRRKDYDRMLLQSRMLDGVADAVIAMGPDEKILYWNDAATKTYGWQRDEVLGRNLTSIAIPDAETRTILEKLKNGQNWSGEYIVRHRDGHLFPVFARDSAIFDDDGRLVAVLGASNDITERKRAEESLQQKHNELNAAYETLRSTQEQLRQNIEELSKREHELNEALREKEILLSEVHHRVKNNLTAFISLLSLESAYDESPAGLALKKDLQNRARSMALIHETLYRTKKYSRVDMDVYLSTLARQVVSSYESAKSIQIVVDANGITLDLSRATPCGLIINELLTNSLKYAFPASFNCETIRCAPCTVEVHLMEDAGSHILTVRDNGIGLPGDLNLATTKTLGLKLVSFLAKHQLRASIEVHSDTGAEFRFRFKDKM